MTDGTEVYYLRWDEGVEDATRLYVRVHDDPPGRLSAGRFDSLYRRVATVSRATPDAVERAFTAGEGAAAQFEAAGLRDLTVGDVVRTDDSYAIATLTGWAELDVATEFPDGRTLRRS